VTVYILSAGGHGRVVASALMAGGISVTGIVDRDAALVGKIVEGVPVVGTDEDILSSLADGVILYNGLGNVARRDDSGLSGRRALFERFRDKGFVFPALVSVNAFIAASARLAAGAQVMAGSLIQAGAQIGENTIVNTGAIVEHDCHIGRHSHIAPGAVLCGSVSLGDQCHIGAGAIVLQGLSIPMGSVIPAGAVIRRWGGETGFKRV
jgi:sugar O-acyltransferase (sialic acid O-acetyltransferase NeuD family)